MAGQVRHTDPGEDQEAGIVGEQMQVPGSGRGSQPMKRSRGATFQAAAPKSRHATSRP